MPLACPRDVMSVLTPIPHRLRGISRVVLACVATGLAGCVPKDSPLRYPFVLHIETQGGAGIWAADLDGDGVDEDLLLRNPAPSPSVRGPTRSILFASHGEPYEQTNYSGEVLEPRFLDVVGDARPEVVVPVIRHDSLFLSVASGEGKKLFGFFLTSGRPRTEPDGTLPWDPSISGMWAVDLDGDGIKELVTSVTTVYAREPRGIIVNALPGGEEIGEALVGAYPVSALLDDFDGDGHPDVLMATFNSQHGADRGGFSDASAYLIRIALTPLPHVTWSRTLEGGGMSALAWTDVDGDGRREVLLARSSGGIVLEALDARTLRVVRRRTVEGSFYPPILVDLNRDLLPEVVAGRSGASGVVVVSRDFESVESVAVPISVGYGSVWPDLDDDGIAELEFRHAGGFVLLDPEMRVKAAFGKGTITGVEDRGRFLPPLLLIRTPDGGAGVTLQSNPWFLFVRFGPGALAVLLPISIGLFLVHTRRLHYRLRVVHAAGTETLEAGGRGLMVLDSRGRIRWRGRGLDAALRPGKRAASNLEELARLEPSLAQWCREVSEVRPARQHTDRLALEGTGAPYRTTVSMGPVVIGSAGDPHWIVRIGEPDETSARAWPMMAQRIAHAVKNPLTHMLLTVQRLQAEYRERAPAVASRLDPYAERIQDGIGQLRQLTSSFLKLVDLAEPELEATDVAELTAAFGEKFRAQLPHDIRLDVEIGEKPPETRVDREQIRVALDNLCTNAVNALESGGTITLSVTTVRGLRLDGARDGRDYVQIEVMDTGKGIAAEVRENVFEPGYTTAEDGSGLGLAIVRKIVTDHGGRISLESEAGVGTVFTLQLPISASAPPSEERT